jgi:acetylglutamate kinase
VTRPATGRIDAAARPWVVKLGGELVEPGERLETTVAAIGAIARRAPLVVVHGGGREIDAETTRRGLAKRAVDGLRLTDAATLDAVVAVLAGTINTRFVARLVASGVKAVGLTGADAASVPVERAAPLRASDGRMVDLGLVGEPVRRAGGTGLLAHLLAGGFVPVMASLGADEAGALYNVNADTMAAHVAARLAAVRLVFAGATAGVLDPEGRTLARLDARDIESLVASGTATAGMVAKLVAARRASAAGVDQVAILDGRHGLDPDAAPATHIVPPREAHSTTEDR